MPGDLLLLLHTIIATLSVLPAVLCTGVLCGSPTPQKVLRAMVKWSGMPSKVTGDQEIFSWAKWPRCFLLVQEIFSWLTTFWTPRALQKRIWILGLGIKESLDFANEDPSGSRHFRQRLSVFLIRDSVAMLWQGSGVDLPQFWAYPDPRSRGIHSTRSIVSLQPCGWGYWRLHRVIFP